MYVLARESDISRDIKLYTETLLVNRNIHFVSMCSILFIFLKQM